jgi:hypothetical protein
VIRLWASQNPLQTGVRREERRGGREGEGEKGRERRGGREGEGEKGRERRGGREGEGEGEAMEVIECFS